MEKLKSLLSPSHSKSRDSENFRHWALAFIVCNFNVDVGKFLYIKLEFGVYSSYTGPEIELVYPADTELSTADLSAVCFNSFPERQETETGDDLTFHFTVNNNSPDIKLSSPQIPYGSPNEFYGSCVFRQEFDNESKRSFNQKSLVLISNHKFPSFHSSILRHITSAGAISDPDILEAAFTEISSTWPTPGIGRHELPFMGSMMVLEIPPHQAFPLQGLQGALPPRTSPTQLPAIFAYEPTGHWSTLMPFMPSLNDLYAVYESILLCESVVVVSRSPQLCSDFVSAAIDLIKPVPFNGIIKEYVTMQSDFKSIGLDGGHPRPFIIGVTNPFLLRRLIECAESVGRGKPTVVYLQSDRAHVPIKRSRSMHHHTQPSFDMPGDVELYSLKKTCLKADRNFTHALNALLLRASETSQDEITSFVRRQFAELTAQFLSPINRFLATSISPAVTSPGGSFQYANFSASAFLHSLSKHGTSVKFRGQGPIQRHRARDSLYERFCDSSNWHSWLQMKISLEREATAGLLRATAENSAV
ncbi:hypothetical protein EJ05DRAFT_498136 [Pseudovirgaria hyperparasitica]|uniref:UDENN domain-containing protein n=1 Tax=Pseudovirgaria hyperparasitica TaxID=470096 RepID=A0A6A6WDV9_9PEZI|nr:uncharacterized protein EJ05DRAFT_498136 [Pseudovirgaria hyperparasitica]KAF2760170.1 hypothetical protein EJ05DRAFT_498136 [Pseudovirgaria hyperparasitica]